MNSASDVKVKTTASLPQDDVDDYPEGGLKAWIVLCGTVSGFFATFGYVNSWGVFQAYYQQSLLHHSTPSEISWIGSIQHAMIFLPALIVGRLFDIGYYRAPFAAGSLLILLCTFLVPQCKVYWHFMLCQGFGVGIGSGLMVSTMLAVVTHWFQRRRGFAVGVTGLGGALGSTIQPIILRQLIARVGFPWAMRSLGFILAFVLLIANMCIARRLSPVKAPGGLLGLHAFRRSSALSVFAVCTFVTFLGLFAMSTYISSSAIAFGISPEFAFYLVAIANFSGGVGRVSSGLLGDRFGPMNIMIIMTVIAGAATIAWPFCRTIPNITGISIVYGFSSGAWIILIVSTVGQMGGIEDLGRRLGAINTIAGVGALCGPPISGLFADSRLGYIAVGYFAGSALFFAASLIFVSRCLLAARGIGHRY
ncbi:MFS general substrate transporter [Mycena metata]|uniref:MFS general substrate transporter n=1 Tax=Mycena metata TaxID=1033252 RepID=A0AAD7ME82_9AGAR|nr:MFS general substrate transporter [Mycena metata]